MGDDIRNQNPIDIVLTIRFQRGKDIVNDTGNEVLIYKTKKYGIPCERKFEINQNNIIDWADLSLILELPLPEITLDGLLPNETKWLDFMVDFNKGCFLGQEQASRVKFRGRPRRLLQSNKDFQEFIKI